MSEQESLRHAVARGTIGPGATWKSRLGSALGLIILLLVWIVMFVAGVAVVAFAWCLAALVFDLVSKLFGA